MLQTLNPVKVTEIANAELQLTVQTAVIYYLLVELLT